MRSAKNPPPAPLSVLTPVADWVSARQRSDLPTDYANGRVVVKGLVASHYLGGWKRTVLFLFKVAVSIPLSRFEALRNQPQLNIPVTAHFVRIRLYSRDVEIGSDRGMLWTADGVLYFEGLDTRFVVGKDMVERTEISDGAADAHWIVVRNANGYTTLKVIQLNIADHAELRRTLGNWNDFPGRTISELLPPIQIQPRRPSYLLGRTIDRARILYAIIAGAVLMTTIAIGYEVPFSVWARADALVVVAAIHLMVVTYRKVRRDEEEAVRKYQSEPPPIARELTAEEISVGVRLNAMTISHP